MSRGSSHRYPTRMTPTHAKCHFQIKLMNMVQQVFTTVAKVQHHPPKVRMWHCILKVDSWHGSESANQISGMYAQGDAEIKQHLSQKCFSAKNMSICMYQAVASPHNGLGTSNAEGLLWGSQSSLQREESELSYAFVTAPNRWLSHNPGPPTPSFWRAPAHTCKPAGNRGMGWTTNRLYMKAWTCSSWRQTRNERTAVQVICFPPNERLVAPSSHSSFQNPPTSTITTTKF